MIRRQLEDVLASYGVKEIKALGEIMDPMYHEAMLRVIKQDCREGEILQVLKKRISNGRSGITSSASASWISRRVGGILCQK